MNLAYLYPPIYWATAVITVEAGALDIEDANGTNYAKVSAAIGRIQSEGYNIELPLINKAQFAFTPDAANNIILYGLKGISEVGDDFARSIINNRPYASVADFIEKCKPQKKQMINLIKSGAFNEFGDRRNIMNEYLTSITPKKARITLQNMGSLIEYSLIPKDLESYVFLYNFNKYIKKTETPNGLKIDDRAQNFVDKHYPEFSGSRFINSKEWDKKYKQEMETLKNWFKENEETLIESIQSNEVGKIWEQYCQGTDSAWEMEVLGFYHSGHELQNLKENVKSISELEEGNYKTSDLIAGTVLGKDANKHTVTILTTDGVIILKLTAEKFAKYNRVISKVIDGTKKVLEKSWFNKGTLVLVNGFKMGETFRVKHMSKIIDIDEFREIKSTKYRHGEG